MKINIDLHILKKIISLQRRIDKEVTLADKHWKGVLASYNELKALTEFIEGEAINPEAKNDEGKS